MEVEDKNLSLNQGLTILFLITFLFAVGASFYKYYYTKNYDYLVEASCDPSTEKCFHRDCSNADDCPPNGLSYFKEFYVKAYDFPKCTDDSCKTECTEREISCVPISCEYSQECADSPAVN